ncbi:hypothetical protein SMALB_5022 [Streptomyces malaysiensis]|uniref:Uncharacterized protein n=1 Tax=Streptomyces malaysiensis TaxID=92644 RepID=A0A7X5X6W8_STRMQ|nr:hypothetical protein [Streptomyces malaysiensis]
MDCCDLWHEPRRKRRPADRVPRCAPLRLQEGHRSRKPDQGFDPPAAGLRSPQAGARRRAVCRTLLPEKHLPERGVRGATRRLPPGLLWPAPDPALGQQGTRLPRERHLLLHSRRGTRRQACRCQAQERADAYSRFSRRRAGPPAARCRSGPPRLLEPTV